MQLDSPAAERWWHTSVVYQIYPRSFADSDGDGVGDLGGIIARLDHLVDLGVDVVWLSPVYRSPMDDNGYDISDYQDIDPAFGTLAQFDELVAAAHARGLKIVMDLVVNHTSDEHPWFVESRSSLDNPKRDWYWWRSGAGDAPPNNWTSFFGGPAWARDPGTGEYYLHLFSTKQPDLNWENPQVRQAIHAMMRWWLERGVDGFRMDVINMISKVQSLPDGTGGDIVGAEHFLNGPRVHEFLHEMNLAVFGAHPEAFVTVGETPGVTIEQARRYTDRARREVDMVFQFEHVSLDSGPAGKWDERPLRLVELKASLARWQLGLADVGWNSLYLDNHDQPRAVSRFGDDDPRFRALSAKALALVLHLHRGTPYIYQGEEIGMTNMPFGSLAEFRDIESLNYHAVATAAGIDEATQLRLLGARSRDNARTPMQWDAGPAAGFTTGTPWIGVNPNHVEINAADQRADPASVLAFFRALIGLRRSEPAVALGNFELLLPDDDALWIFTRRHGATRLLVAANLSRDTHPFDVEDVLVVAQPDEVMELALCNYGEGYTPGTLRPWEACLFVVKGSHPG